MLTNDGNAILREIDVSHPAAKVRAEETEMMCMKTLLRFFFFFFLFFFFLFFLFLFFFFFLFFLFFFFFCCCCCCCFRSPLPLFSLSCSTRLPFPPLSP